MNAPLVLEVEIRPRWWLRLYIDALLTFVAITGAEPDCERVAKFIAKHGFSYRVRSC